MNLWIFIIGELLWIRLPVTCNVATIKATTFTTRTTTSTTRATTSTTRTTTSTTRATTSTTRATTSTTHATTKVNVDTIPATCIIREKVADCSYRVGKIEGGRLLETFPNNVLQVKASLESLDISENIYQGANISQFTRLTRFVARNLQITDMIFNRLLFNLQRLESLEELDLSGTHRSSASEIETDWPSRIVKLSLSNMWLEDVRRLTRLDHLQELDLSMNQLTRLPRLNREAPLILINLRENQISRLSVEEIAPFCELVSLRMDNIGNFTDATNYPYCAAVERWTTQYHIQTDSLQCSKPSSGEIPNIIPFSAQALRARQDCLTALPSTSVFELLLYAIFFSVLFPLLYFANEAYQRYQSRKQTEASTTAVKKRRKRKSSASGSDIDLETGNQLDDLESEENESEKLGQSSHEKPL